eukprot:2990176-Ditylum_brightwellii.AAC.1
MGESRMYTLHTQPEEDNSCVKQVIKGQNVVNMGAAYTLVQDLLRDDTLAVFNNEQATFEEQMADNLDKCLNAMTLQVFPNKAYKLQKQ